MENMKKLLLKNITSSQMNKINTATFLISPALSLASTALIIANNYSLDYALGLFLPMCLLNESIHDLTKLKNEHLTKYNSEIYDIYKEVLDNYNDLNKTFNFSNPIEMSVLLNYATYNGYLSKDKVFTFGDENVNDIYGIRGANILAGNGVCRHIAKFFGDVLTLNNIHNDLICVSNDESNEIATVKDALLQSKELELDDKRIEKVSLELQKLEDENNFRMNNATHCINFVYDGKNSYFIDPTNESLLYTFNADKNTLSYKYHDVVKIFYDKSKSYSDDKLRKFSKYKYLPGMDEEEYNALKKKTTTYIDDGIDVLEKFYNDNNEAYDEIHNLIKK